MKNTFERASDELKQKYMQPVKDRLNKLVLEALQEMYPIGRGMTRVVKMKHSQGQKLIRDFVGEEFRRREEFRTFWEEQKREFAEYWKDKYLKGGKA